MTSPVVAASRFACFCFLLPALLAGATADAQVLTGSIVNYPESDPFYVFSFGDGTHSVKLSWSVNILDRSGYFYRNWDTEVALASGVSAINQITNAGAFSFTTPISYYIGPVYDAAYTGGRNSFVVLKNATDNFFGVVRVDDIFRYATPIDYGAYGKSYSGLNATWWFQSDGTGDFSSVPEPQALLLLGLGMAALWLRKLGRAQPASN